MAKGAVRLTVKVVDRGWKKIQAQLEAIRRSAAYAKVGVLAEEGSKTYEGTSLTTAQVAVINEFGSPKRKIPSRPFLRSTFNAKRSELQEMLRKLLPDVYAGKTPVKKALSLLGLKLQTEIRKTISIGPGVPPPNAPYTIRKKEARIKTAKKGAGRRGVVRIRTLVDTGQLLQSITYAVVMDRIGAFAGVVQEAKGEGKWEVIS